MKWDTEMVTGATPSTDSEEFWLDGDSDLGTPFVAIADMSRRAHVTATARSLTPTGMTSRDMPLGTPGTLLLAMYASVGEVAFLDIKATWNQALLGITPHPDRVDPRFLRYVLLDMRNDLLRDVRSNTQANLNATQIGDIWFQRPPIDEQRAIAGYLDRETARIDTLIQQQQRLIELLLERRRTTVELTITGIRADRRPLRRFARLVSGSGFPVEKQGQLGLELPFFKVKDLKSADLTGVLVTAEDTISRETAESLRAAVIPGGSLVFAKVGAALMLGRVAALPVDGCIDNNMSALIFDSTYDPEFARYMMLTFDFSRFVQPGAVPSLDMDGLREFRVPLIPLGQQQEIAADLRNQVARIDTLVAETERCIEMSRERRSALVNAAVTGQIDVREAA